MPERIPLLPETLILPEETILGHGKLLSLLPKTVRFGHRGLLVHGRSLESEGKLAGMLAHAPAGTSVMTFRHRGGEPTLSQVSELIDAARQHRADWIAGIGGGSVLDLAKAAAALVHTTHPLVDYHNGLPIEKDGIAFLAIPTTAGTGSEVTINAVLTNAETGSKKSIRSIGMMARVVILDPDLIATCPRPVIAASGMDALTQAIEGFTSRKATWLSDQLARQGLALIAANLQAVYEQPDAPQAEALLTGSYLTGIAFSFARLGLVHGIAHPLGSLYHVPHGVVCAACLPYALELNRESYGDKYRSMSEAVGGDLLTRVGELSRQLKITSPFAGQVLLDKARIIRETLESGSTQSNPRRISQGDVEWLIERLFQRPRSC
jgi:alcohol dehydrogenase class IV